MTLAQSMLPELDQEMKNTRRSLERIPDGKFDWKPHPKSMTLGRLANHLAEIPVWALATLNQESFDVAPPNGPAYKSPELKSREEILALFDKNSNAVRDALAKMTDQSMGANWSLLKGAQPMMTMPRVACFRSFILNHMIHHRAQLGVYLRMTEQPVPAIYGPSADEGQQK